MAPVVIQDGRTCNFWEDVWNSQAPKLNFPELFSYAKRGTVTFQKVKAQDNLWHLFQLPLSTTAFAQHTQLTLLLDQVAVSEVPDVWTYVWGSSQFSSQRAYKHLSGHIDTPPVFKWLWKSFCHPKHKVFFSSFGYR
jgi:hypothetical protein